MSMDETKREFEPLYTFSMKKRKALKVAIDTEDHEMIRTLFTKSRVNVEDLVEEYDNGTKHYDSDAPLNYAYETGKLEVLKTLMECGNDPGHNNTYMKTPLLEELIKKGDTDTIRMVLPYAQDIHNDMVFDLGDIQIKTTILGLCAYLGKVEEAKLLVDRGYLMKPWSVEEALERDEDCRGTYMGSFNLRKDSHSEYFGPWEELMLEPWQFAVFCDEPECAAYFLKFGQDGTSMGFAKAIIYTKSESVMDLIEAKFPKQTKLAFAEKNRDEVLEAANGEMLKRFDLDNVDISCLGTRCTDETMILDCYHIIKERLNRQLTLDEKRALVKLMLQKKSSELLKICEAEWAVETSACDISDWADWIPVTGSGDRDFVKLLEQSTLSLEVHADHTIFDERYYYFDHNSGCVRQVRCLDHVKNLAVLDKVVQVIPPEKEGEELLYFTKKVLDMGKKSAFERLKKWGLVHEGNMGLVSEYIVENNLEQFYDQAIRSGETKNNQKKYDL